MLAAAVARRFCPSRSRCSSRRRPSPTSAIASASCPIVGFLLAGVRHRPARAGPGDGPELVDAAAEMGVILLLFTIGIEFSLEKLARIKTLIFGGGGLQVALASLATLACCCRFGVDWRAGLFTGFPRVAVVDRDRAEAARRSRRDDATARPGQRSGLLIFQDLAIIVMVLLVPMLGGSGGSAGADRRGRSARRSGIIVAGAARRARGSCRRCSSAWRAPARPSSSC